MEFDDKALAQGAEVDQELRRSGRTLKGLLRYFQQPGEFKPRRIRKVRELYRYSKMSQMIFDLAMRMLLNFGNWTTSVGLGLNRGFSTFHISRKKFHAELKLKPPIHITESQAKRDLEALLRDGKVVWED